MRTMGEDSLQAAESVGSLLSALSCWTLQMKRTTGEDDLHGPEDIRSFISVLTCWILQTMKGMGGEDGLQSAVMLAHSFQLYHVDHVRHFAFDGESEHLGYIAWRST